MAPKLAITGSTGAVGGRVARLLSQEGFEQRLLIRRPGSAPDLPGATSALCPYDAPSAEALSGIDVLFMVSGTENEDRLRDHCRLVDAAASAGVRHIVYTSFYGAAPDATFTLARDHHATEQHIQQAGLEYTFLRDNFYADVMEFFVGDDGVIRGPSGDGRVALVARADVARVAAHVLAEPHAHSGTTYDLTGPKALTMSEVAATISAVRGRPVSFHDETVEEAYASRAVWNAPEWQNDAWVSTYTAIASGEVATVTDDVERVIGRRAMSLEDVLLERDPTS